MIRNSRREFLADVGRGMLVASVGTALSAEMGLAAFANEDTKAITFGDLEPLVRLLQDTPAEKLLPAVVGKIRSGTDLKTLIAAASLANARTFAGQDYIGFHSFMALAPALDMSREMPKGQEALPVLKVLYRNTDRMQELGGHMGELLEHVHADDHDVPNAGEALREAERNRDWKKAEETFARSMQGPVGEAYNHLQWAVQDEVDVHRVVLAWRAWATIDLTGKEHAHTLLRQSVRYCVNHEERMANNYKDQYASRINSPDHIRQVLPKLMDQYALLSKPIGKRKMDEAWIEEMSQVIVSSTRPKAADSVAAALADGVSPEDIGEAISLASNTLLLRDTAARTHGDSKGVHASDSAAAWRQIARVSNHRNTMASLVTAAFHTGGQGDRLHPQPYPFAEHLEKIDTEDPAELLKRTDGAIRENNQTLACALVHRYGTLGNDAQPAFDLLRQFAISEDGRLHAEKYYWTAREEFAAMRPAFKWRQLAALARVSASAYGYNRTDAHGFRAPGYEEACQLLGVAPTA